MIEAMPFRTFGPEPPLLRQVRDWFSAAVETVAPSICLECGAFADKGWVCVACSGACRLWDDSWCRGCGLPADHGHAEFCPFGKLPDDRSKTRKLPWAEFRPLGAYAGFLRSACLAGKRPENSWLFQPLAREWLDRHHAWAAGFRRCLLVPVPRHWSRRWMTGHDPAIAFARALLRVWSSALPQAEIRTGMILKRIRATPRLADLDPWQRARTVKGVFRVAVAKNLRLESFDRIVLVDDIATTGATALAAAAALLAAGARNLELAVIARTLEGRG